MNTEACTGAPCPGVVDMRCAKTPCRVGMGIDRPRLLRTPPTQPQRAAHRPRAPAHVRVAVCVSARPGGRGAVDGRRASAWSGARRKGRARAKRRTGIRDGQAGVGEGREGRVRGWGRTWTR